MIGVSVDNSVISSGHCVFTRTSLLRFVDEGILKRYVVGDSGGDDGDDGDVVVAMMGQQENER